MAHLSGDESLSAMLQDPGQDPFTQWAAQWLRVKPVTAVSSFLAGGKRVFTPASLDDIAQRITPLNFCT